MLPGGACRQGGRVEVALGHARGVGHLGDRGLEPLARGDPLEDLAHDVVHAGLHRGRPADHHADLAAELLGRGTLREVRERAAQAGAKFVMSPADRAYLDMKYTPEHPLGQQWAAFVELHDSYDWDPATLVEGLPESAIEGVSAAVWTETLLNRDHLFSMLLPRLAAVAEAAWSQPGVKDWESFRGRIAVEAGAWRRDGASYHPTPQIDW